MVLCGSCAEPPCDGGREVHGAAAGTPGAPNFLLSVGCFAPLSPPAIASFLNQWEAIKYLDSESAEGRRCCCTAFWGGSSCRWAAGKTHRRGRGEGRELLRQQKIELRQRIDFLLSAHAPKRFLPRKRGSRAWRACLLWYPLWLQPQREPGLRPPKPSHSCGETGRTRDRESYCATHKAEGEGGARWMFPPCLLKA